MACWRRKKGPIWLEKWHFSIPLCGCKKISHVEQNFIGVAFEGFQGGFADNEW
jgi:hypothetical protein